MIVVFIGRITVHCFVVSISEVHRNIKNFFCSLKARMTAITMEISGPVFFFHSIFRLIIIHVTMA